MDDQEFLATRNEFDLENVRSNLIKCICELQSRRNEVTSLKSALDEATQLKNSLAQDLADFKRENEDLRNQLKITMDALNRKNSVKTGFMENAARQNVQLEAMTNEHERLNAKLQSSHVKIMELTRENNKLQEQIKVLQTSKTQPAENVDHIWKAMDTLNGNLKKLEEDHVVLTKTAESSTKIAEEAAIALASSTANLDKLQEENAALKNKILNLESTILSLKPNEENSPKDEKDCQSMFNDHVKQLRAELDLARDANAKLKSDISSLLTLQECLTKQLEEAVQSGRKENSETDSVQKTNEVLPMEVS